MIRQLELYGPFDLILDTVSDIYNWYYPPLLCRFLKQKENHSYKTLGGSTLCWFKAWIKKTFRLNLFSPWHELIWVNFANTSLELTLLSELGIKPVIQKEVDFTADGIKEAFSMLDSRRAQGKVCVVVSSWNCVSLTIPKKNIAFEQLCFAYSIHLSLNP